MKCIRCGTDTPRLTVEQRYCPTCIRELARLAPQPSARWVAPWLRRLQARDQTGLIGTGQPL